MTTPHYVRVSTMTLIVGVIALALVVGLVLGGVLNKPEAQPSPMWWEQGGLPVNDEPTFEELQRERYLDCVTAGGEWLQGGVCDWTP